eukprot:CAMPEP_0174375290 /NCGR_PEP_ID=MMETSP0811_2-20130205/114028_1 /TAXON_ID=73025 ORGANISM="Eutreptiella gymnastica-like, Strain CCMP1594" /NCGR_SAMPLE_ID=MMETSP0811_2 /ASSEMBLY_ACC=CAM_ASM_000667 /LENGTH=681 /DNA_ID=CAMNT_0015525363 /DNA_START=17 /DNA_END=2062 /DNA_ORIENTATION=+
MPGDVPSAEYEPEDVMDGVARAASHEITEELECPVQRSMSQGTTASEIEPEALCWSPQKVGELIELSDGGCTATDIATDPKTGDGRTGRYRVAIGEQAFSSGKQAFAVRINKPGRFCVGVATGMLQRDWHEGNGGGAYQVGCAWVIIVYADEICKWHNGVWTPTGLPAAREGDVIQVEVDCEAHTVAFLVNGQGGEGSVNAFTGSLPAEPLFPIVSFGGDEVAGASLTLEQHTMEGAEKPAEGVAAQLAVDEEMARRLANEDAELVAAAEAAHVPPAVAVELAAAQLGAAVAVSQFPHLAADLDRAALTVLVAAEGGGDDGYRVAATLALRHKVWQCRNKERFYHGYTQERSEAAMRRWVISPGVAEKFGLPAEEGHTWLDVVQHVKAVAAREAEAEGRPAPGPAELWNKMSSLNLMNWMFGYKQSRCLECGSQKGRTTVDAPRTDDEKNRQFNLEGRVYVLHCADCGKQTRWWRSQAPEICLNPNNWGRRCGEQSDMKVWFAGYMGVGNRYVISVDNDHIWTESWNDAEGRFVQGHVHGNGWTEIIAIGSSLPGTGPGAVMASEHLTERYLENLWPGDRNGPQRSKVDARRRDATGKSTQLHTLIGYACARGGLDAAGVTAVLRAAHEDYDAGRPLAHLGVDEAAVRNLTECFGVDEVLVRNALITARGNVDRAATLLLG